MRAAAVARPRVRMLSLEVFNAAAKGEIAIIQNWLAEGGDPNEGVQQMFSLPRANLHVCGNFERGSTLLMPAASKGRLDVLRLLVAHDADVNVRAGGYTVLLRAGSFSDQAGHFGSSWPGGGERPPIRYEDSQKGLRGPSDTQLLIYSYIKR